MITDSHAHVYYDRYDDDRDQVLARARAAGVERMIVVGTDVASSRAAFELAARERGLFPTAGIHPHDAAESTPDARREIEALCRREECVAVGESGLDFFKNFAPRDAQLDNFRWQLALARSLELPIVVHCRDAHEDVVALLREQPGVRGVMHCYTLGEPELAPYLELGFYISFSGVVTYPKNVANQAAARAVPEERLLVETDCPFLAPQGHRGQRNEPALARVVLEKLAQRQRRASVRIALTRLEAPQPAAPRVFESFAGPVTTGPAPTCNRRRNRPSRCRCPGPCRHQEPSRPRRTPAAASRRCTRSDRGCCTDTGRLLG
jgi:TatD DNase family protein